jgi:hypothetical protein
MQTHGVVRGRLSALSGQAGQHILRALKLVGRSPDGTDVPWCARIDRGTIQSRLCRIGAAMDFDQSKLKKKVIVGIRAKVARRKKA